MRWNGQANSPVQRARAPSSPPAMTSRTTSVFSGHGHLVGKLIGLGAAARFSSTTSTTCGITSPARWIVTVSPMRTPSRSISILMLCKRRVLHHHAADRDRLELGDRGQRAGAADLDLDVAHDGGRALGRELVRDRPARSARHEAKPLLPVEAVDLVDDAVDVVVEPGALQSDVAVKRQQLRRPTCRSSTADWSGSRPS